MAADTDPAPLPAPAPHVAPTPPTTPVAPVELALVLAASPSQVRWVLRRTLERTGGFEVLAEEGDGFACLTAVRDQDPDAVLVDLDPRSAAHVDAGTGPEPDGWLAVVRVLRASRPDLPVVVLASPSDPDQLEQALRSGAVGVVNRDAGPVEVVAQVRAVLTAPWTREHPAPA